MLLTVFFFTDPAPPGIYTLSLHDALPILAARVKGAGKLIGSDPVAVRRAKALELGFHACVDPDRKSTRLNSSHVSISYAVFCLKKKKQNIADRTPHLKFLLCELSLSQRER